MAYFTKLKHFLNEDGDLPSDLPGPARKLALFICSLVKSVTSHSVEALVPTGVRCRRRPKRKPCTGEVFAFLNEDTGAIQWNCFKCGDNGFIYDWEDTKWDMRDTDLIPVRLHVEERDLILNETLAGPDLTAKLETAKSVSDAIVVYYSTEELDGLIGYIAAEANHNPRKKIRERLDALCDSLEDLLDSYMDLEDRQD
ncbi:MAG: hypothetical protein JXB23_01195 [Candidatus Aminicenantes bacterium]|nr:hypothetical protein [Candidatus Aminicenantes bacterium]